MVTTHCRQRVVFVVYPVMTHILSVGYGNSESMSMVLPYIFDSGAVNCQPYYRMYIILLYVYISPHFGSTFFRIGVVLLAICFLGQLKIFNFWFKAFLRTGTLGISVNLARALCPYFKPPGVCSVTQWSFSLVPVCSWGLLYSSVFPFREWPFGIKLRELPISLLLFPANK